MLLAFLPPPGPKREEASRALAAYRAIFNDRTHLAFGVIADEADFVSLEPQVPGLRYFHDPDGEIALLYGLVSPSGEVIPQWVLIDPMVRILSSYPIEQAVRAFEQLTIFSNPEDHAGVPLHAPVLIVPRVFEPEMCRQLISVYRTDGGSASGVMRDIDGKTVGVLDDFKKRRDADVTDDALKIEIQRRVRGRLLPQIAKSFMFNATRMERYIVARYDAEDGGYFRAHRDNTTLATAHRQFACSINLNAEDFEGGDLRFPEFGRRTYRPPTGGAVIFSCSLLHEATPVTRGERFAFLPFFYDDTAARIREENIIHLDQSKPGRERPV